MKCQRCQAKGLGTEALAPRAASLGECGRPDSTIDEKSTENMGKSMVNLWKSMGKHSENMVKVWELKYPLVICYIAIEDGHLFR